MAISYVGQATGTNTATLPTHQTGDVIVIFAYRDGSTTAPTVPADCNSELTNGGNTNSAAVAWKVAASASETIGTFTNATSLVALVYRGADNGDPIGVTAATNGSSTTVSYPALGTFNRTDSSSWVVGFAGHRSTDTTLQDAPTGMVNRANVQDATDEASGHDSNGGLSSWSLQTVSVGGTSSGWVGVTLELKEEKPQIEVAKANVYALLGPPENAAAVAKSNVYVLLGRDDGVQVAKSNVYVLLQEPAAAITLTAERGDLGLRGQPVRLIGPQRTITAGAGKLPKGAAVTLTRSGRTLVAGAGKLIKGADVRVSYERPPATGRVVIADLYPAQPVAASTSSDPNAWSIAEAGIAEEEGDFVTGASAAEVNLRYSDLGLVALPNGEFYENRLLQPLTIRRTLPLLPEQDRRAEIEAGLLEIANADRALDATQRAYAIDGRRVWIRRGRRDQTLSQFLTVFKGRARWWSNTGRRVRVAVRDEGSRLDKTLQSAFFGGGGGSDGGADVKGKPKPLVFGAAKNITPVLVDAAKSIYQVHTRQVTSFDAVYDRGATVTTGTNRADYAALDAATVTAGQFDYTSTATGSYFRLGTAASGLVTCDITGDSAAGVTCAGIATEVLTDFFGLTAGDINIASTGLLAAEIGWYAGTVAVTGAEALSQIIGGVGGYWGADPDTKVTAAVLAVPSADGVSLVLREGEIKSIRVLDPPEGFEVPRYRFRVGYDVNWTVQTTDLAGSVSQSRRSYLADRARYATWYDAQVQALYLLAQDPGPLPTLFRDEADAQTLADLLGDLFGVRRQLVAVDVEDSRVFRLGDVVQVFHPEINSGAAFTSLVAGIDQDVRRNSVTLTLWG